MPKTLTFPAPLIARLEEMALDDRFASLSEYVSLLLLAAVRQREAELKSSDTRGGPKKPKP